MYSEVYSGELCFLVRQTKTYTTQNTISFQVTDHKETRPHFSSAENLLHDPLHSKLCATDGHNGTLWLVFELQTAMGTTTHPAYVC